MSMYSMRGKCMVMAWICLNFGSTSESDWYEGVLWWGRMWQLHRYGLLVWSFRFKDCVSFLSLFQLAIFIQYVLVFTILLFPF